MAPKRIYLQWHGDSDPAEIGEPDETGVTWSRFREFEGDVRYTRTDLYMEAIARAEAAEKRVKELEAQLAAQAWRPVTEPPDKKGSYLLAYDDRNAYCLGWWHGKDSIYGWGRYGRHATHWQPLPAPPQDTPASGRHEGEE